MVTAGELFDRAGLWRWFDDSPSQRWGVMDRDGLMHRGVDWGHTFGTPVGAIEGGKVVHIDHNNNSLNDRVVIQGKSGYWEYQHIDARVKVGQIISTAGVVGSIDGLPVDKFSSGPHVHVQFTPHWTSGQIYSGEWGNPMSAINAAKSGTVNDGIPTGTGGGGSQIVNQTSSNTLTPSGDEPGPLDIQGQLQHFFNAPIQSAENGLENFVAIAVLLIIAIVTIVFGVLLLSGNMHIGEAISKGITHGL